MACFGLETPLIRRARNGFPLIWCQSSALIEAARTLRRTRPGAAVGLATSRVWSTSAGPYRSWHTAFMFRVSKVTPT